MRSKIKRILEYFTKPEYKNESFGKIGSHVKIGRDCLLVPQNMYLDDHVLIQNNCNFISYKGKLVIKRYSVISSSCIIIPSNHVTSVGVPFYVNTMTHVGDEDHTITVEEDVWVGAGSILLPNCNIGRGSIIGAGSVVTKTIPPYSVAVGNPARIIAVKFSKEDILKHEALLYPENERLSENDITELFDNYFSNVPVMKKYEMNNDDRECVEQFMTKSGISIF